MYTFSHPKDRASSCMKAKKKLGTKHQIREEKKREQRIGNVITVAISIAIIFISGFIINSLLNPSSASQPVSSTTQHTQHNSTTQQLGAAIVDQMSLSRPNQTFIQTATNVLEKAGFFVEYHPGEEVTIDFFGDLPAHDYRLVVLRVHSAVGPPLGLFTSEPYSQSKYVYEQINDQLQCVAFSNYKLGDPTFFGISPNFVSACMNGKFQKTIIIAMGCDGLTHTDMARAFIQKGAKAYIGWTGSILGTRNDPAITHLLSRLVIEKQTIEKAVADTMREYGSSSIDSSVLLYYPLEAGTQTIENLQ